MDYYIGCNDLTKYCSNIFLNAGLDKIDSDNISDALVKADMRGIYSHGVIRIKRYIDCIKAGGIKSEAKISIIKESASWAHLDGNSGLGIPISCKAMKIAVEKAKSTGVGVVCVRNSHHFGAAGYYSAMCADEGMIGIAMSNGDPIMAATGSSSRVIGNNPFSYALPAGKYRPVIYDIAMSTVASGKIEIAHEQGQKIPEGWLLDRGGRTTSNPAEYLLGGALTPFGGYKGYGLAVMVECFAGILSGSAFLDGVRAWNMNPDDSGNTGHFFLAMDVSMITPIKQFKARVDKMIEKLTGAPRTDENDRIYYPGQIEWENEEKSMITGVKLCEASMNSLKAAAHITGVEFKLLEEKMV